MKVFTTKKIIIFAILVLISIFFYAFIWNDKVPSFVTEEIKKSDLQQIVNVNSTTESNAKISLRFQNSGQIDSINFKTGDTIQKDDLIASLVNDKLEIELEKAAANLDMANAELNLKYAGPSKEETVIAWTQVEEAEINLKNAKQIYEDTMLANAEKLKKGELDLDNAKVAFANAEKSITNTEGSSENLIQIAEDSLKNEYEKTDIRISSAYNEIKIAINASDQIIGIEDPKVNDEFQLHLGTKSFSINGKIIDTYSYATRSLDSLEENKIIFEALDKNYSLPEYQTKIDVLLQELQITLGKTKDLLDMTYQLLELSTINNDQLQSLKQSISQNQTKLNTEILNTETLIQSIDLAKLNLEKAKLGIRSDSDLVVLNYDTAKNNLQLAETALNSLKLQNTIDRNNAQMQIDLREVALKQTNANYQNIVKTPRYVDTAPYIAKVDNAQASYRQVEKQMEDNQILAPMNGLIIDITKKIGENISAQEDMVVMMTEKMQLKANISESDINKVKIGDKVKISFDSLPISEIFEGTVSAINPAETVISGVIYYEAYVLLKEDDDRIKSGMTADLEIETASKENVVVSPIIAIEYDGIKTYAYVLEGDLKVKKEVMLGLEGEEYVEVKEGLKEGEKIIIYEK